jgi:hypothetical protein
VVVVVGAVVVVAPVLVVVSVVVGAGSVAVGFVAFVSEPSSSPHPASGYASARDSAAIAATVRLLTTRR